MIVRATVEMPKNTCYKYEIDKQSGNLVLDRFLRVRIPFDYGFINNTLSADGDPLDVFVISHESHSIVPKTIVSLDIQGGFECIDNGVSDDKLFGLLGDQYLYGMDRATSVIRDYLENYKTGFEILRQLSREEAIKVYMESKK